MAYCNPKKPEYALQEAVDDVLELAARCRAYDSLLPEIDRLLNEVQWAEGGDEDLAVCAARLRAKLEAI